MKVCRKPIDVCALCLLTAAFLGISAQTVSVTKKRIPVEQSPEDSALHQLLGAAQAAMDKQDYATAAQDYHNYLAKKPDDAYAHFQLGYAYTNLHQSDRAETEYRQAIELDSKMAPAYLNLGLTLLEKDPAAAIRPLERAAELLPNQARPKYILGRALESAGQVAPAIEQFQAAAKLDPKNIDVHLALGRALLRAGRASEAESEFRAGLALGADSGPARLGLVDALLAQQQTEAAGTELEEYLKTHRDDADAHFERASLLAGQSKNDEALAELDRASAGRPESLASLRLRSTICLQQRNLDAAADALAKAVTLAPGDADLQAHLGHILLEKKNYPAAAHALGQALQINPEVTDALRDLLATEYLSGNYPRALQLLDLLAKRETPGAGPWFIRATCYDKMGQKEEALAAYQKFLELNAGKINDQYFEATARARFLARELKDKKH